jgi:hypothetical protein
MKGGKEMESTAPAIIATLRAKKDAPVKPTTAFYFLPT